MSRQGTGFETVGMLQLAAVIVVNNVVHDGFLFFEEWRYESVVAPDVFITFPWVINRFGWLISALCMVYSYVFCYSQCTMISRDERMA